MGILDWLKGTAKKTAETKDEQAVLVYLDGAGLPDIVYSSCDLITLEERLAPVLAKTGAGEFDGNESGPKETCLFFYGADSEVLFNAIEPVLRGYPLCQGARVIIRKGKPGAAERELKL